MEKTFPTWTRCSSTAAILPCLETRKLTTELQLHRSIRASAILVCSTGLVVRERSYTSETVVNSGSMLNETAKLMEINAKNMIALHFRRRLHQYIRFRNAPKDKVEMKYKDVKRLVDSCFRVKTEPVLDEDGQPTGRTTPVWTERDETNDPVEKELRKRLGIVPWQFLIRENSGHFVRKLFDMLSWMEPFVEKHPSQKGARVYSLLPVATSFQPRSTRPRCSASSLVYLSSIRTSRNTSESSWALYL